MLLQKNSVSVNKNVNDRLFKKAFTHIAAWHNVKVLLLGAFLKHIGSLVRNKDTFRTLLSALGIDL